MINKSLIKVLIVDDDTIVRRGLKATVDWGKYGMVVVGDAPNGKRGWEEFLLHEPEVVITDIVMPEENGLEFSRKIKAHSPKTKILLLSCHKDFEYAQEGLKLGASGYLLKTVFEDHELDHFLRQFQQELAGSKTEEPSSFQESFLLWLNGYRNDFAMLLEERLIQDWEWMKEPYYVYLIRNAASNREKFLPQNARFDMVNLGTDISYFFIEEAFNNQLLHVLSERKLARSELDWISTGPLRGTEDWMKAVMALNHAQLQNHDFHEYPKTILSAVEYIVSHLSYPMTVADIADYVGMSRSHLSTLFKKNLGISIHSFIEKKRLQLTKQLLKLSSIHLQEVGEQIGIQDAKYLSKWFKRCTGMTPSQYRSQQNDEKFQTK